MTPGISNTLVIQMVMQLLRKGKTFCEMFAKVFVWGFYLGEI